MREKGFKCTKVDGANLPFEDNSFDAVVFFEVIEHVPEEEVETLIKEIGKVLKPGGVVLGSTPNYPAKRYYAFFSRIAARKRQLFSPKEKMERSSNPESSNCNSVGSKVINKNLTYFFRQITRLFADDPTHVFSCNFGIIQKLGTQYFREVELYTTFSGKARRINTYNPLKIFSHKIVFIFRK